MHMFMYVRMCVCVYVCPSSPALFPSSPALFPSAPALFPSSPALFPIYIYICFFTPIHDNDASKLPPCS